MHGNAGFLTDNWGRWRCSMIINGLMWLRRSISWRRSGSIERQSRSRVERGWINLNRRGLRNHSGSWMLHPRDYCGVVGSEHRGFWGGHREIVRLNLLWLEDLGKSLRGRINLRRRGRLPRYHICVNDTRVLRNRGGWCS